MPNYVGSPPLHSAVKVSPRSLTTAGLQPALPVGAQLEIASC